ncbi:MAG: hypothetical protein J4N89_08745 [Chloroflexi bacterium]|nr:hypothetical protein [Chloroflexota bacterium]MCI0781151.1 hypothetical protein [Chloroflexota bacterium]MCI0798806.1 hypothetical protein [Chloroflexota bacterium]MCI0859099.1 hypothetical protein [Chloroflexota bacterium]MCI0866623.1 hypothetical protein [Chloroflexota bacterium]
MAKITDEMAAQFVRLNSLGRSYRAIGKMFGVDPRTVKSKVQGARGVVERDHWESVTRQVDAKYLEDHYRLIVRVAVGVLRAVRGSRLPTEPHQNARVLLDYHVGTEVMEARDVWEQVGIRYGLDDAPIGEDEDLATSMARKLFSALGQHQPELERTIDTWQKCHAQLVNMRRGLIKETGELLGRKMGRTEPNDGIAVADLALNWVFGKSQAASAEASAKPEMLAELLMEDAMAIGNVHQSEDGSESQSITAQRAILEQIIRMGKLEPVATTYGQFATAAAQIESRVTELILRRQPKGKCFLCPQP